MGLRVLGFRVLGLGVRGVLKVKTGGSDTWMRCKLWGPDFEIRLRARV